MPGPKHFRNGTILLLAATLAGACEQTSGIAPTTGPMFSDVGNTAALPQFNDVLIPAGAKIYVERTLILGENPWYGQLTLGVAGDLPALFEQYRRDMQSLGWQEVTSIRAAVSVITFMREDRVATVQIQASRLRGSEVTITVSPRGGTGGTPARGGSGPIRPAPVQRQ
ncbi:MAG: hypothetical protein EXR04_03420 [Rhodospirillales bacterium]|nr:hypothetical protein [Rhodospirillales bacterium]